MARGGRCRLHREAPLRTALTDRLYGVPRAVARFERDHPDEPVRVARACKATRSEGRRVERGIHWAGARRTTLLVTEQRVVVGPWDLPTESIVSAEVVHFRQLGMAGAVLLFATTEGSEVQVGISGPAEVLEALPVEVIPREGGLGYSPVSAALRVLILVWLGWWVYRWWVGG